MEQLDINQHNDDTICAVSTPAGVGGIAVVRVSGRDAVKCVMKSWRGADLNAVQTHTLHLGRIVDTDGETLDEVVAAVFRGPRSFTGEDVIELSCHGSLWVQQQLVALLIGNGCRAAEGGEFTRRAFMNGRLDLSQAEAVADVIASGSKAAHRIAVSQMRGGFSRMLSSLRERLLEFVSLMELELDFSEEDVEFADRTRLIAIAEEINTAVTRLADSFAVGNAIKNGFPVAIVGEPNAGKSTLLNRLLHDDKALVSDIRSGNGNFQGILDAMERLKQGGDICRLLFVTADLETIIKRYKETRRRHPLMSDGMTIEQAMHREQELLRPLREHADFVIDTTLMPAAKLRNELYGLFGDKSARGKLSVNVVSFGFKYGIPLEADLVFDVRFLPNPFYVPELKHKTGMDSEVYDYVFSFPQTKTFIDKLEGMLSFLLPLYAEEGKSTLVIAVGCTGGHHRSVSVARCIASYLTALGYPAFENHRDITRG